MIDKAELNIRSPREQRRYARQVLHRYRSNSKIVTTESIHNKVEFIGVFDTVNSVGIPINSLRNIVDKIWQKVFNRRLWGIYCKVHIWCDK